MLYTSAAFRPSTISTHGFPAMYLSSLGVGAAGMRWMCCLLAGRRPCVIIERLAFQVVPCNMFCGVVNRSWGSRAVSCVCPLKTRVYQPSGDSSSSYLNLSPASSAFRVI